MFQLRKIMAELIKSCVPGLSNEQIESLLRLSNQDPEKAINSYFENPNILKKKPLSPPKNSFQSHVPYFNKPSSIKTTNILDEDVKDIQPLYCGDFVEYALSTCKGMNLIKNGQELELYRFNTNEISSTKPAKKKKTSYFNASVKMNHIVRLRTPFPSFKDIAKFTVDTGSFTSRLIDLDLVFRLFVRATCL